MVHESKEDTQTLGNIGHLWVGLGICYRFALRGASLRYGVTAPHYPQSSSHKMLLDRPLKGHTQQYLGPPFTADSRQDYLIQDTVLHTSGDLVIPRNAKYSEIGPTLLLQVLVCVQRCNTGTSCMLQQRTGGNMAWDPLSTRESCDPSDFLLTQQQPAPHARRRSCPCPIRLLRRTEANLGLVLGLAPLVPTLNNHHATRPPRTTQQVECCGQTFYRLRAPDSLLRYVGRNDKGELVPCHAIDPEIKVCMCPTLPRYDLHLGSLVHRSYDSSKVERKEIDADCASARCGPPPDMTDAMESFNAVGHCNRSLAYCSPPTAGSSRNRDVSLSLISPN